MTKIYNKISEKEKRRKLRNNMTKAEVLLWLQLKNKQILGIRFLRQYSVGPYVVDFYAPEVKLAIEVDGATHVTDEEIEYDKNRQATIENLNISFLRFTNQMIYEDMYNVLETIKKYIRTKTKSK
jgi:very-short-patch-repair endonuclease